MKKDLKELRLNKKVISNLNALNKIVGGKTGHTCDACSPPSHTNYPGCNHL
ncbi:hypothetical protein SAMN04488116_2185 [Flagellimonas flava]|uniref:Uncharacterized protein n=1 Tax=Flagellimonas flava TaxID=570519 RepID=A0A1M5M1I5_9FLAO|nr:hypothetical protein SAMN04488116_2185 [Allomuricauda flava]